MADKAKRRPVGELVFDLDDLERVEPHFKMWDEFWHGALGKLPELDTQDQVDRFIEANRPFVKALLDGITFFEELLKELKRGNADKVFVNASNMFTCAGQMLRGSDEVKLLRWSKKGPSQRQAIGQARASDILREFIAIMSENPPPPSKNAGRNKLRDRLAARLGEDVPSMSTIEKATKTRRGDGKKAVRGKTKR